MRQPYENYFLPWQRHFVAHAYWVKNSQNFKDRYSRNLSIQYLSYRYVIWFPYLFTLFLWTRKFQFFTDNCLLNWKLSPGKMNLPNSLKLRFSNWRTNWAPRSSSSITSKNLLSLSVFGMSILWHYIMTEKLREFIEKSLKNGVDTKVSVSRSTLCLWVVCSVHVLLINGNIFESCLLLIWFCLVMAPGHFSPDRETSHAYRNKLKKYRSQVTCL